MNRSDFVRLAFLAFGLILLSFVILGLSRIALPYRTAQLLSAPTMLLAALLVSYLFVRAALSWVGVRRIE
ncbi:hypothetical protein NDI76_12000 [Halogeometricum sp. S1BR25-6]|uniref:Uncharacterized protein n=1 Tax=Halogeometricum salsisoli TaxID=2950536 RepID=A0ABU2GFA9_9EURY|nr:hypothetical protein [Halogeometricum sp. S1BR25-6]MDS0299465.1 hypothetical protein [Halogeometricum sp. S1BR25-6]